MEDLFLRLVNMSLAASVLGAAVLLLRALLKGRLPRWTFCLLWGLVLVRLLVPFSVPSPVSAFNAIPAARTVETGRRAALRFVEDPGAAVDFPTLQTPRGTGSDAPAERPVVAPAKVPLTAILSSIWLCGAALLLLYSLFCYLYTMHRLRRARRLPHTPAIDEIFNRVGVRPDRVRLYVSDLFPSPVVCGLVRPRLVLSGLVEEEDVAHVVTHELTHIRRHDNLWKALATFALYLHWFNPLVWLFYRWYVTDMEASCDEAVVRRPETDRKAYAYSLVNMAERSRSAFAGGFLAFGECALKERVKSIMHVRKNTVILTIIAAAVVAGLAVVFLTNPQISPAQTAPSGSAADLPGAEVPEDVAADMKLTYSVLGSLREKDVAEMWVRYGEFGDSPEAEIPPDGYGEVIGGLQELTLGWESTDRESEPVEIVITRKDGKQVAVSLRADSVRLSGTAPKLADKSTVYVYKADVSALRAYALGLLAPAERAPAPMETPA
ncbi:M56 family metallopeptidase, partial [uncultured Anaerotruncus sp.]